MNNNPRNERLSFLRGLLRGTRTLQELTEKQEVFFIMYTCQPGVYYRAGKRNSDSNHREEITLSRAEVEDYIRNPKFKVQIINITYENEVQGQERDSTFP